MEFFKTKEVKGLVQGQAVSQCWSPGPSHRLLHVVGGALLVAASSTMETCIKKLLDPCWNKERKYSVGRYSGSWYKRQYDFRQFHVGNMKKEKKHVMRWQHLVSCGTQD